MNHKIETKWTEETTFIVSQSGGQFVLTTDLNEDESPRGLRPKALMLSALGGCTAMDVASLFKKMRATPDGFKVDVSAHLTEENPKYYDSVKIDYYFYGKNLKRDKLQKCVDLSLEKYCGVSGMFRQFAKVQSEVFFEEI